MKNEIGGYFEYLEYDHGYEYHEDCIALNSARNAFLYFVKTKNIKKVYIPFFLCDSIYRVCQKNNIVFECYHINKKFRPCFNKKLGKNELFYLVNYYGQISDKEIHDFQTKYPLLIVDNVQCFFKKSINDIPAIYSCRKITGVSDGGYLYSKGIEKLALKQDDSFGRDKHLFGRKNENADKYYSDYISNEKIIDNLPLEYMSKQTKNIMRQIDNDKIIELRNKNFRCLSERLSSSNKIEVVFNDGPFAYPFYFENGDELRKILISKKIYVPLLWPNVLDEGNEIEKEMAKNILPLPCDQRYSTEEMAYICDIIKKYVEK